MTEQEALYGSKPSPSKSGKKVPRMSSIGTATTRRATMAVPIIHTSKPENPRPLTNKKINEISRYNLDQLQNGRVLPGMSSMKP